MCGLCGIFGETSHWSTQGVAHGSSRRQRIFRVKALNAVLALVRLHLRDFSGTEYVLSTPTGAQTMIREMGQLWQCVEDRLGHPLDPLNEDVIAALETEKEKENATDE